MDRAEQQLRLIQAVYRAERARKDGAALEQLRSRCETLLRSSEAEVAGEPRLQALLEEIRDQLRS